MAYFFAKEKIMKLAELQNYVFKTRIYLEEGVYIELREPTQKELIGISDDSSKNLELLERIFPACVVDTSIEENPSGKEIYDVLKESGSMMTEILTTWLESIPFQSRLLRKEKSDK